MLWHGGGAGLGLGLSIAREIVRGHGQTLSVQSRFNAGSLFTFELAPSKFEALEDAA